MNKRVHVLSAKCASDGGVLPPGFQVTHGNFSEMKPRRPIPMSALHTHRPQGLLLPLAIEVAAQWQNAEYGSALTQRSASLE